MITSKLSKTIAIMNRTKYILDKNARLADTLLFIVSAIYVILL